MQGNRSPTAIEPARSAFRLVQQAARRFVQESRQHYGKGLLTDYQLTAQPSEFQRAAPPLPQQSTYRNGAAAKAAASSIVRLRTRSRLVAAHRPNRRRVLVREIPGAAECWFPAAEFAAVAA
jgi:hypothetical protein